jgi:hypothetical protein
MIRPDFSHHTTSLGQCEYRIGGRPEEKMEHLPSFTPRRHPVIFPRNYQILLGSQRCWGCAETLPHVAQEYFIAEACATQTSASAALHNFLLYSSFSGLQRLSASSATTPQFSQI